MKSEKFYIKYKLLSIICFMSLILLSCNFVNKVFAHEEDDLGKGSKLSSMQSSFFTISELKESNVDLLTNQITNITDKFTLEKTINKKTHIVNVYSYNNERLSIYTIPFNGKQKVEGIIYKVYNPTDNITILRMQYHDFENEGKYIRYEVTTESISELDNIVVSIENNIGKNTLYSDYIKLYNRIDLDKKIIEEDLLAINPKFKKVTSKSYSDDPYNHYLVDNASNELLYVNTNKSHSSINSIEFCYGNKIGKYRNCITTLLKEDLDVESIKYLNLSNEGDWGHTLMIFKDNIKELQDNFNKYNL